MTTRFSLNSGAFGAFAEKPVKRKNDVSSEIMRIFLTLNRFMRVNTINFARVKFINF
jgi:hypothetical protein